MLWDAAAACPAGSPPTPFPSPPLASPFQQALGAYSHAHKSTKRERAKHTRALVLLAEKWFMCVTGHAGRTRNTESTRTRYTRLSNSVCGRMMVCVFAAVRLYVYMFECCVNHRSRVDLKQCHVTEAPGDKHIQRQHAHTDKQKTILPEQCQREVCGAVSGQQCANFNLSCANATEKNIGGTKKNM